MRNKVIITLLVVITLWGCWVQYQPHKVEYIKAGPGVTETRKLSDYYSPLMNGNGDTDIYLLEGEKEGGVGLILGGTHANEIAGIMSTILMIESGELDQGKLLIIPHTNASAITNQSPMRGDPWRIVVENDERDKREFRYGSRFTHPLHQWPDGNDYLHVSGKQTHRGAEARNLNRVHPGRDEGTLTEMISYALFEIMEKEDVDVIIDFHEAGPESILANTIITHPKSMDIGSEVVLEMEFAGLPFSLDQSNLEFRGLSHREFGEFTDAVAILTETANPYQGSYFMDSSLETALNGKEEGYRKKIEREKIIARYENFPLNNRVSRHISVVENSLNTISNYYPDSEFKFNLPRPDLIRSEGVEYYLNFN